MDSVEINLEGFLMVREKTDGIEYHLSVGGRTFLVRDRNVVFSSPEDHFHNGTKVTIRIEPGPLAPVAKS